jgi:hypothetical protein
MNGYICFYNGNRTEVHADSMLGAITKAVKFCAPPKSKVHMVHCHLAEKDGEPVVHSTTEL